MLIGLRRLDAARDAYAAALALARRPADHDRLFGFLPRLFDAASRTAAWTALQAAVVAAPAATPEDAAAAELLGLRLDLALRRHDRFVARAERVLAEGGGRQLADALACAVAALRDPAYPDRTRPKVFCIGLSKTGTSSVCAALERLGLAAIHWTNPLTGELIAEQDVPLFDAFADIPVTQVFETYWEHFPNAKFIHTVRPLEAWQASFAAHYRSAHGTGDFALLKALMAEPEAFHHGARFRTIHQDLYFRFDSLVAARAAHAARVGRFFHGRRADCLLELNLFANQGWPQLCAFLGRPEPAVPFPWANAAPLGGVPPDGDSP